jgi:uncharacterized membrane protein
MNASDAVTPMRQIHYLPLSPAFFSILVGLLVLLIVLIQVGALRYVYLRLGVNSRVALLLLLASLFGSYLNIPVAELPDQQLFTGHEIYFAGVHYPVPVVIDWPGTIIAVNVGGALIPRLCRFICSPGIAFGVWGFWLRPASQRCVIIWRNRSPGWASHCRHLCRPS